MSEWISVKDRLPEDNQMVLAYKPRRCESISFGYFQFPEGIYYSSMHEPEGFESVTHWMPLPQPPKELERSDESEIQGDE